MAQIVYWYNSEAYKLRPIEPTAKVHADFISIHLLMAMKNIMSLNELRTA